MVRTLFCCFSGTLFSSPSNKTLKKPHHVAMIGILGTDSDFTCNNKCNFIQYYADLSMPVGLTLSVPCLMALHLHLSGTFYYFNRNRNLSWHHLSPFFNSWYFQQRRLATQFHTSFMWGNIRGCRKNVYVR